MKSIWQCYWPFIAATVYSFFVAAFAIGHGDDTISSNKGIYKDSSFVPFVALLHVGIYLLTIVTITHYFASSSEKQLSRTLRSAYYFTLLPGLLQIFRIYSGIHFNIPYFERADVGPFSGVFDAGYLRLMGFEFEPLAYASSLIVVCCLSMHNGRRVPWLGLVVLAHTYGTGAIAGLVLALLTSYKTISRFIVPLFMVAFALLSWWLHDHFQQLAVLALANNSIGDRILSWDVCISMWLAHPFGVGLGLYGYFFNRTDLTGLPLTVSLDVYPNNDPGMFLAYGGLIYLAAYFYAFYFVLRRRSSYWIWVAAAALLYQSLSSYLFFNPAIILVFSMMLARSSPIPSKPSSGKKLIILGPLSRFPFGVRFLVRKRVPAVAKS
jgi:hypothetical protein